MAWLRRALEALRPSLWLFPGVALAVAVGLSYALGVIDERLAADASGWYLFRGGPEGARAVLGTVATSIMTFTGVVFSVTILVLQLASEQFSPRVLRSFLGDRATQLSLAVFVGTFVYALLTLRSVRGASEGLEEFVPSLSVWFAVALAVASVATFIFFVHHVAQQIRVVNVLARLGDATRASLSQLYPEGVGAAADGPPAVTPPEEAAACIRHRGPSGVLVAVDEDRLWRATGRAEVTLALLPSLGDFVVEGTIVARLWGDGAKVDLDAIRAALVLGKERTFRQDTAFGFRSLVDVALRALSPSVNDPTTAVQTLDQLHDLLRRLAGRRFPDPVRTKEGHAARLVLPRPGFDDYVRLALEEIRLDGASSVQVARRLRALLEDVLQVVPPWRTRELRQQLAALDA